MEKYKTRNEVPDKYKWDLTPLYKDIDAWNKDYDALKEEINVLAKYQNHLLDNADTLYEFISTYYAIDRKLEKVYYYAHLNYDAETTNSQYQELSGKVDLLFRDIGVITAFVEPELLKSDYSKIEEFYKANPKLKEYHRYFEEIYRYKKHILSLKEETLLSKLSDSLGAPSEIYEKLTDSDLTFNNITDEDGKEVELTDSNYSIYIRSKDRNVRKAAFKEMYRAYKGILNTLASTYYNNAKVEAVSAELRNYPSSLEASLYADKVSKDIYNNLIDTVSKNLDSLFEYYNLKKDVLGLDEMHLYDIYADMDTSKTKEYTFEEARDIVLEAIKPLGDKYVNDAKKAFTEGWIDVCATKGKRGGAYSSGGYDTYPYMLLNFEGNLNDVSTIIHELGHSMHSYYSKNNNSYQEYNYRIFVAEVASITNELLLYKYLLDNSDDKATKLHILNGLMDLFKGTLYRQTMFAEFERDTHELVEKDEILTPDLLCENYYKLNQKYFGKDVVVDEEIKYEWERIPHFYYNFYVYKYATSLCAATYIATNIYNGNKDIRDKYLKFLSLGGSMDPIDELKVAGVDMTDPKVIESAIKMFSDTIKEYKKVM